MKSDTLTPKDLVKTDIFDAEGRELYTLEGSGFQNLRSAITAAFRQSHLGGMPNDYVYRVTNLNSDVTHRYRLNADENLTLIEG